MQTYFYPAGTWETPLGADMQKIQIGKHGLMIEAYGMRGLLLPQVAVEEGLNASEFLDATCEKADLPLLPLWVIVKKNFKCFLGGVI